MLRVRIIPCLLLKGKGLVKTIRFGKARYVGDPINAVRIFNEKEVDEIVFLDINASVNRSKPQYNLIERIANEAFMPFGYGGGIHDIETAKKIFNLGAEKIILNSSALDNPLIIKDAAKYFGNQSVVVSLDVRKNIFGSYHIYGYSGTKKYKYNISDFSIECEKLGAGEIILHSIDRDGTYTGYDLELIKQVTKLVKIPVVSLGGASSLKDFSDAVELGGAHAVAAGSLFTFAKKNQGVLINYPNIGDLEKLFS